MVARNDYKVDYVSAIDGKFKILNLNEQAIFTHSSNISFPTERFNCVIDKWNDRIYNYIDDNLTINKIENQNNFVALEMFE